MTKSKLLPAAAGALGLLLGATGAALADSATTQTSPLATEPLPTVGAGQAATGAAVGGSAPDAAAPSTVDNSQEQQGVLLKPGEAADDMNAAAGGGSQRPAVQPQQ
jgi:hypothetical protein